MRLNFSQLRRTVKRHWKLSLALSMLAIGAGEAAYRYVESAKEAPAFELRIAVPTSADGFALALYQSLGTRLVGGHAVFPFQNGTVFDALVDQINAAKSSVNIAMYIWENGAASDRVVTALVARARAGVRCRILVDDVGSPDFAKSVQPALARAGCEVRVFRPLSGSEKLARNHRKLIVVDGLRAITGGFGIRDSWLGDGIHADSWRDTNVLFSGPAVSDAQQVFAENWQEAGGALLAEDAFPPPSDSGRAQAAFVGSTKGVVTRAERLIQLMISAAQRRIWIANAYFVPSQGILKLLKAKAKSGVDVRLLAPYKNSDSKTAFGVQHLEYGSLLQEGIKVWEYDSSMMHAKTMLVDDELALVGSINLDPLSLNELEEDALVVRDRAFADQIGQRFGDDCDRAKRVRK